MLEKSPGTREKLAIYRKKFVADAIFKKKRKKAELKMQKIIKKKKKKEPVQLQCLK